MTSPQGCLNPARGDDRRSVLRAFQPVAGDGRQLAEVVGAEVRNRVTLEPCPQVLDGIEFWTVRRQESDLNVAVERVQVLPDNCRVMGPGTVPDDQQRLLQMC